MSFNDLEVIDTHYTQKRLNEELFLARVPYIQSRHPEDIKKFGVRVSGIKSRDSQIKNEWITTMLNVATMVKYYTEFVPLAIVKESDTKLIYDLITEHILAWRKKLERGINIGDSPIKELIEMDKFANTIYAHAKYQFNSDEVTSLLAIAMNKTQTLNASNFFKTKELNEISKAPRDTFDPQSGVTVIDNNSNGVEPIERESHVEFFINRSMGNLR